MQVTALMQKLAARRGLALVCLLFVIVTSFIPLTDNDVWLQIKIGELTVRNGSIPATALFPYTEARDYPLVAHEWLPSVFAYLVYAWLGYIWLMIFKVLFALLIFGLIAILSYQITRQYVLSLAIGIFIFFTVSYRIMMRPEIFAYTLILVNLNCICRYRAGGTVAWLLVTAPLAVLWANSHGSYMLQFALIPIFAGGDMIDAVIDHIRKKSRFRPGAFVRDHRWYAIAYVLGVAGLFVNPYGTRLFVHSWQLSQSSWVRKDIYEWNSPFTTGFMADPAFPVFMLFLAVLAIALVLGRRRINATTILLVLLFGYLAFTVQRHIAVFGIVSSAVFPVLLQGRLRRGPGEARLASGLAAIVMIGSLLVALRGNIYGIRPGVAYLMPLTPQSIEFIKKQKLRGNVINSYTLGSQLIFHFHPDLRVLIDSRIDVYGEQYLTSYKHLLTNEALMLHFINQYDVAYMIFTRNDFYELLKRISVMRKHGWNIIYGDKNVVIIARGR